MMDGTGKILEQGKALVRAIEAMGPLERSMVWLLLQTYRRRLRAMVGSAPAWISEQILRASQQ